MPCILLTVRERISYFSTKNLAFNLIDKKLKKVKTIKTSDGAYAITTIGDEIWWCQSDGICVYDDTLYLLRHLKLGPTDDAALLSQRHIVTAGFDGLRLVSKSGKMNDNPVIIYKTFIV